MTRLGIVARADRTGLAAQMHEMWKHMNPAATLVVDLSRFGFPCEIERYEGDPNVTVWDAPHFFSCMWAPERVIDEFLEKVDVVFCAETCYNHYIYSRAREKGIKTVLQPNYEFFEWAIHPELPKPDVLACPTSWHIEDTKRICPECEVIELPCPVDTEVFNFTQRTELRTILHSAGTIAQDDRAGTLVLIEAMKHVKQDVRCVFRAQKTLPYVVPSNCVAVYESFYDRRDIYTDEDVFVLPRRYGGNCLPAFEAAALGMPVIMPAVAPQFPDWITTPIDASPGPNFQAHTLIETCNPDPIDLVNTIDYLARNPHIVKFQSDESRKWAQSRSWIVLKRRYEKVLNV